MTRKLSAASVTCARPHPTTAKREITLSAEMRPVYTTRKHRAEDLAPKDVTRNSFGKWARVTDVSLDGLYVTVSFDSGTALVMRDVQLVDVQVVKPS
jgi:hypothetical protein